MLMRMDRLPANSPPLFGRRPRVFPQQLETHVFDTVIIGDGANGSALLRELALRGASVAMIGKTEPNRPTRNNSRLYHGGLRYLEYLDLPLVYESRREVQKMLRLAKHLIRPIGMMLPVYEGDKHPRWKLKAGLNLYDWFTGIMEKTSRLPRHRSLSRKELTQDLAPGLTDQGKLKGGFLYYDAQVAYPDRLTIETVQDALSQHSDKQPVHAIRHAEVVKIQEHPDLNHAIITFKDLLTQQTYQVKAKYVINAAGPKVDEVIEATESQWKPESQMGPTKGTHILVQNTLGLKHAMYSSTVDDRPFFIIPFPIQSDGEATPYLLIGTTDDKEWTSPYPTWEEVEYLLESSNRRFPGLNLSPDQVLSAYAGFRPLPKSDKSAREVTRRHIILKKDQSRVFHIIGGKLTTQRSLADEVANQLTSVLPIQKKSPTLRRPLPGSRQIRDWPTYLQEQVPKAALEYQIETDVVRQLVDRYGSQYKKVLELTRTHPELKQRLAPDVPFIRAQVQYALQHEQAETLMDILIESLQLDLFPLPDTALEQVVQSTLTMLTQEKALTPKEQMTEKAQFHQHLANNQLWKASFLTHW